MLRECMRKTGCRIKITQKKGLPFQLFRYRKRRPLLIGTLIFIITLYTFASFIWAVEITGNERIPTEDLQAFSENLSFKPGTFKPTVNTKDISRMFMSEFPDISFISIEIKGTKAKISITETLPKAELIDKSTPCDIVAKKDGLIVSMVTSAGTPKVKVMDVVQKGDVLVSGKVEISELDEVKNVHYVHAYATVVAKSWYEANISEKFDYIEKDYTGESKKSYELYIGGKSLSFLKPDIPYSDFDTITVTNQVVVAGDFALPIFYTVNEYREFTPIEKSYTEDELKQLLTERLDDLLKNSFEKNAKIIDKELRFEDNDNGITLQAVITIEERIDEEKVFEPILDEQPNSEEEPLEINE